ncbi:hypothetical protein FGU46_10380 [Methanobacterium sp. CWC-01]|uniref:hypothetical protein n=1 Tax=Methanobacterium aridiramus TaxID=2584467 RepID=UPI002578823B|nr:hypothetical protein [Methanobacterium sp. CWC-01]WJI10466.1 hypothetical protein FGU46_10380 [Methanobacterium sp. CWC-01]
MKLSSKSIPIGRKVHSIKVLRADHKTSDEYTEDLVNQGNYVVVHRRGEDVKVLTPKGKQKISLISLQNISPKKAIE